MNILRHEGLVEGINLEKEVLILGCGSIGTAVATTLARIGYKKFTLQDMDIVEEHNIANQYFEEEDIGKNKTEALEEKIKKINKEAEITIINREYVEEINHEEIKCLCVDSMAVRKKFFENNKRGIMVDGRMGGTKGQIHFVKLDEKEGRKEYSKSLYTDSNSEPLPCTARTIIYMVLFIAAGMTTYIKEEEQKKKNKYILTVLIAENNIHIEELIKIPCGTA